MQTFGTNCSKTTKSKSRNKLFENHENLLLTHKPKIITSEQSLTNSLSDKENHIEFTHHPSNFLQLLFEFNCII